jgi:hypothetical protein
VVVPRMHQAPCIIVLCLCKKISTFSNIRVEQVLCTVGSPRESNQGRGKSCVPEIIIFMSWSLYFCCIFYNRGLFSLFDKGSYQISLYIYQKYNIIFYGTLQMQGNVLFTCRSNLSIEYEKTTHQIQSTLSILNFYFSN